MILAILQARVSSSRLPLKVLKEIMGKPMLELQVERVRCSKRIDRMVIATSIDKSDDPIEQLCCRLGVGCFRGSLSDVLDRYYRAALEFKGDTIARITGDCPLFDPIVADAIIESHLDTGSDYTSNTIEPTFPDGLDVEVMKFESLEKAWREAKKKSEREHVTYYIYTHPELFKLNSFQGEVDRSAYRWTVDEPEDFDMIQRVYESLYPRKPKFSSEDVIALLEECPDLLSINAKFRRNEGLEKSLRADGFAE